MQDYVGAILGLVRDESDWRLDPLMVSNSLFEALTSNIVPPELQNVEP